MTTNNYASFQFATNILNDYDSQIQGISDRVAELELLLNELRNEKKVLEAEKQALQTLAGAGQSAIDQAARFLSMARSAGRTDMVAAFWNAIDNLRGSEAVANLPAPGTDPAPATAPEPAPEPTPSPDAVEVVEVTVVAEVTQPEAAPESAPAPTSEAAPEATPTTAELNGHNGNGNGHNGRLTLDDLNGLTIQMIRKLATSKGVSASGKRFEIAERLYQAAATHDDLAKVNN